MSVEIIDGQAAVPLPADVTSRDTGQSPQCAIWGRGHRRAMCGCGRLGLLVLNNVCINQGVIVIGNRIALTFRIYRSACHLAQSV